MRLLKSIFYSYIFLGIIVQLNAQIKSIGLPEITNYKRSDYKGGTQNWDVDQDKNGNLYFANNSGLLKFDGSSWSEYSLPNFSSIRSLRIGNSGKIYVGGYSEFGYFQADKKGKLRYFSVSKLVNENTRPQIDFIWRIHEYNNEIVFQSFERAYIYNGKTLKLLEAPGKFQFSFVVNNRLYFQDTSLGLMEYRDGKLRVLPETSALNNTEIWGIVPLSDRKLLVTTLDSGLFIYENNVLKPWETEANIFIKRNSCLGGVIVGDNFIVLNSVLDGIIIIDFDGNIIQHVNRKKGLQNNTVLSSFIDSKKNLWLGLDNGIAFINESSPFTYFGFSYDISTVYASIVHQGVLYVATNQGLFYHSWDQPFKEESFKLVEGTTGQAWNIQVVDGQLFCAHNRGMLQISGKKTNKIIDSSGYWGMKKIPNQKDMYIGSNYNGFTIFQNREGVFSVRNYVEGMSKSASTFEVEGNNVWLKKDDLLYQLMLSNDLKKFKSIKTYKNLSPSENGVGSVQQLNNKVYFQNNNRFYRYSPERDLFFEDKQISVLFKGLPAIRSVYQDKIGNIWYIYNKSIGVLKKSKEGVYNNIISPFSNLTGNVLLDYLSVNTIDSNNIFIGLTDGLAHYDSELVSSFSSKPKAFIRSFSFSGDTLMIGNIPDFAQSYDVPYKANNVKFTFSSPTYENLENVEFSYRLEGFDDKWSNWSRVPIKEYTNLHEGDYKMEVKVRNSYGVQSDPAVVSFVVSPPFYRHFLAYVFYLIAIVSTIYFIRTRIRMKIRKNKYYETIEQRRLYLEKEAKIRQEQFELEKEIERLKNDKLKIKILAKDKELVNNSLQVVKKNKILNGIIHKLKDIDVDTLDDSVKFQFGKLNKSIVKEVNADKSWKDLEKHIKNVHFDFLKRLKDKYPAISPRELDLSTYLLMNMSTKEIAEIMNISSGGVELARYRLRKKLGLNKKENLIGFLMSI